MVEDERSSKESLSRNNKSLEQEISDYREQMENGDESLSHLEDMKRKKDVEINQLRKQLDAESEARDKFEQLKNELERNLGDQKKKV